MHTESTQSEREPKIFRTLREDVQRGDFKRSIKREYEELKDFMLDEERRQRLSDMSWWRRWFYIGWWLFKSLFFKLTPARRILLVVGIIFIVGSKSVTFSAEQVHVSSDTSGVGGLCILFVLMLELKDKLVAKKELEAGHAVQEALMPERSPSVPGWDLWLFTRSANEVGGDLVDFMKLNEERFGVALADVAGKGLRAALLAAKLQATLRALAPDFDSLSELGAKLNEICCRDNLKNVFASLVYFEVQPNSGSLRFSNAGHLPPLLVKEGKVETMEKGGSCIWNYAAHNFCGTRNRTPEQ